MASVAEEIDGILPVIASNSTKTTTQARGMEWETLPADFPAQRPAPFTAYLKDVAV